MLFNIISGIAMRIGFKKRLIRPMKRIFILEEFACLLPGKFATSR